MSEMTALLDAVKRGALDEVRKIVAESPGLVHQRDDLGATALHNAAFWGQREVVRFLVEKGADINARDTEFIATPAGWAIEYIREMDGFLEIELEDFGCAIERQDVDWVRRFLENFPNLPRVKDRHGSSFQFLSEQSENSEIVKLLAEDSRNQKS